MTSPSVVPHLEFRHLTKVYGELVANDQISLQIKAGRVHALIGENGAGKSTLMKMLFGLEAPTAGQIFWRGEEVRFASPLDAKARGLGMVHQHFMQAPNLRAIDHIGIDAAADSHWWRWLVPLAWRKLKARMRELAGAQKMPVPWGRKVHRLSVGEQQRIEILKLLGHNSEILILDEPTAILAPQEAEALLKQLTEMKRNGKTILLISHKLQEVKTFADDVSVLRRGKLVWSGEVAEKSERELAELMVGGSLRAVNAGPGAAPSAGDVVLRLRGLTTRLIDDKSAKPPLKDLNLELRRGEIFGIAGVEGNGQNELVQLLASPRDFVVHGEAKFLGEDLGPLSNPRLREMGLGLIPPDRLHQAVVPQMTALENFELGHARPGQGPFRRVDWLRLRRQLEGRLRDLDVRPPETERLLSGFSGGNQQKLVVARETANDPELLVVAHPTRGVDLNAARLIHAELFRLRNLGKSVLLVSSDLDELTSVCDRIGVLFDGHLRETLTPEGFDHCRLGELMSGVQ